MALMDGPMRSLGKTMLDVFGATADFVVRSSTYNKATGAYSESNTTHSDVKIKPFDSVREEYVDDSVVLATDLETSVAAKGLSFTPAPGARLVSDSKTYEILKVFPVYSGDQVAVYDLAVRRG